MLGNLLFRGTRSSRTTLRPTFSRCEVLIILILGAEIAGCAYSDITVPMPPVAGTSLYSGGADRPVVVPAFVDKRPDQRRIGMRTSSRKEYIGNVLPAMNVNEWLGARLGHELKSAGFQLVAEGDNAKASRIQGFTRKLFIEPVVGWFSGDVETDLSILIHVSRPDGLEAERRYFVKGHASTFIATEYSYVSSLRQARDTLMKRVVADIINLLNRFQEPEPRL